jgi:hypothetical protein
MSCSLFVTRDGLGLGDRELPLSYLSASAVLTVSVDVWMRWIRKCSLCTAKVRVQIA